MRARLFPAQGVPVVAGGMNLSDLRVCQKPDAAVAAADSESAHSSCHPHAIDFEAIFRRYAKPVLSFLYGLTGDRAQAEELTQETFIRAFCSFDTRKGTSSTSTWLFGIAYNVSREALRQRYRGQRSIALNSPELEDLEDPRQKPDQQSISGEIMEKMEKALAGLSQDHRIVFILKMVHRLHYEEISSITGASVGKLKTDLHRARLEMRQKLGPYLRKAGSGKRGES